MRKSIIFLSLVCLMAVGSSAFADMFENLSNLSPAQKEQLTSVYQKYKQENNYLETRIMEYSSKLSELKSDKDKTPDQLSVLSGAYERNLATLKSQQKKLESETDVAYRQILTAEQYEQYKNQQNTMNNAFSYFLQK